MKITTDHLIIQEATQCDANSISIQNDSNLVSSFLKSLSEADLAVGLEDNEAVKELLCRLENSIGNGNSAIYGGWKKGQLIGFVSIVNEKLDIPELQIEIAPKYQNQGLGYELLSNVLSWLFDNKKYSCIRYTVLPTNAASIALVTKVGAFLQTPNSEIEKLLIHRIKTR